MRERRTLATRAARGVGWGLLALLVATAAEAAFIDLSKAYRERRALVIGINTYTRGWSQLSYARSDAEAVGRTLEALGFRVEYLLDSRPRATARRRAIGTTASSTALLSRSSG